MENKPAGGPVFPQVAQAGSEHTVNGFGRSVALRSCKALAQASCSLQTNSPVECRRRCLEMVSWRDALGAEPQHSKACCKSFPNHHPGRLQSPTHAGVHNSSATHSLASFSTRKTNAMPKEVCRSQLANPFLPSHSTDSAEKTMPGLILLNMCQEVLQREQKAREENQEGIIASTILVLALQNSPAMIHARPFQHHTVSS